MNRQQTEIRKNINYSWSEHREIEQATIGNQESKRWIIYSKQSEIEQWIIYSKQSEIEQWNLLLKTIILWKLNSGLFTQNNYIGTIEQWIFYH